MEPEGKMFLFAEGGYATAGAIGIGVLGLESMAASRRRWLKEVNK